MLDATRKLESVQLKNVSVADMQLAELRTQVGQFVQLNAGVMTVNESILNLTAVMATAAEATRIAQENLAVAIRDSAAATAAAMAAINDNQPPAIDPAAVTAATTGAITTSPILYPEGPVGEAVAAAIAGQLQPYLLSIAKSTGLTADLTQLTRDEADAA